MGERPHYSILMEPVSQDDGGGFLATMPDLPGCMSDGSNEIEAVINMQDAYWLEAAAERHQPIAEPSYRRAAS